MFEILCLDKALEEARGPTDNQGRGRLGWNFVYTPRMVEQNSSISCCVGEYKVVKA